MVVTMRCASSQTVRDKADGCATNLAGQRCLGWASRLVIQRAIRWLRGLGGAE
jgi:hypothetical protein